MYNDTVSLNSVVVTLENVLCIEIDSNMNTRETVDAAIERIENTFSVSFTKDMFSLMEESQLVGDQLSIFARDLKNALANLSFYTDLKLFHEDLAITLADTNYLGYARDQLLTALRYLQCKGEYHKHADEVVEPLYSALDNILACTVKRLMTIILVLHKLGVEEGVAAVTRIVYLGGLVI